MRARGRVLSLPSPGSNQHLTHGFRFPPLFPFSASPRSYPLKTPPKGSRAPVWFPFSSLMNSSCNNCRRGFSRNQARLPLSLSCRHTSCWTCVNDLIGSHGACDCGEVVAGPIESLPVNWTALEAVQWGVSPSQEAGKRANKRNFLSDFVSLHTRPSYISLIALAATRCCYC